MNQKIRKPLLDKGDPAAKKLARAVVTDGSRMVSGPGQSPADGAANEKHFIHTNPKAGGTTSAGRRTGDEGDVTPAGRSVEED